MALLEGSVVRASCESRHRKTDCFFAAHTFDVQFTYSTEVGKKERRRRTTLLTQVGRMSREVVESACARRVRVELKPDSRRRWWTAATCDLEGLLDLWCNEWEFALWATLAQHSCATTTWFVSLVLSEKTKLDFRMQICMLPYDHHIQYIFYFPCQPYCSSLNRFNFVEQAPVTKEDTSADVALPQPIVFSLQ